MLGGEPSAGEIVRPDRDLCLARQLGPPYDHRAIASGDSLDDLDLIGLADNDDPIDSPRIDDTVKPEVVRRNDPRQQQVMLAIGDCVGERPK